MRLWFTLAGPAGRTIRVVTCPGGTTLGDVRRQLTTGQTVDPALGPELVRDLYVGSVRLPDSAPLGRPPLLDGAVLQIGRPAAAARCVARVVEDGSAATSYDGLGHLLVNRPPRAWIAAPVASVDYPAPAEPAARNPVPVLAVCLPMALSVILAWLQHSMIYLLFGLLSPALLLGSVASQRLAGRRSTRSGLRVHREQERAADAELSAALSTEAAWLESAYPGRREVLSVAAGPGARLWERRPGEAEHLVTRVGTGRRRAAVSLTRGGRPRGDPAYLEDVPITVDLAGAGVLGVCGDRESIHRLMCWLVAQHAVWHSPQDLRLVRLAADDADLTSSAWMALLPHAREDESTACWSRFGTLAGEGHGRRRVAELEAVLDERMRAWGRADPRDWRPWYVVVLSSARRVRQVPGVARLLAHGPAVGIVAVCLDERRADLPQECRAVVEHDPPRAGGPPAATLTGAGGESTRVTVEGVSPTWTESFAHAMAALRDATPAAETELPHQLRLLDLVGPEAIEPHRLARRWGEHDPSTLALLGASTEGPFAIDLRHDGPHILVGGTTGSGKSELLQTLVTSLAIANPPDRLGFVLVDYKGGAAFAECAAMPHVLGLVTDLDEHLAERALTSLTTELSRRERLLRSVGAKELEDYAPQARGCGPNLGRLVIVIDEFRMLAEELPRFLDGVVRIAALGRSLGVHLVLATQRPAGAVSADIAANVNLRIALRVRDRTDSEDVIDSPAAAEISADVPGRALARSGANPLVLFQCARVAGSSGTGTAMQVARLEPAQLGAAPDPVSRPGGPRRSDLALVASCLREAAHVAGVRAAHRPWLPPLPELVSIHELTVPQGSWHTPYAVVDRPDRQSQQTLAWNLATDTHLMVVGTLRTGRTSTLRTIAGAIGQRFGPDQVHVHAVDGGSGGLSPIRCLPHTGVVTAADDTARCARLLELLTEEVAARRNAFGPAGLSSLAEQHRYAAPSDRLPYLVVLVDGWESIAAQWEPFDHGRLIDTFHALLRDGAGVGLRVVVTGDRGLLLSRLGSSIRDRVVLRLADPADLTLVGIPANSVPQRQLCGRGVRTSDLAEVQLAMLADDPSGPAQINALLEIGRSAGDWPVQVARRPVRIEPLPSSVPLADLLGTDTELPPGWVVLGVGGDAASTLSVDLASSPAVIAGPSRSGRSTTLCTLGLGLVQQGHQVVAVAPAGSPLTGLQPRVGCLTAVSGTDARALADCLARRPESVVLIDDVERLEGTESEQVVLRWFKERPGSAGLVIAGSVTDMTATFRGLSVVARRDGQGVLLNPSSPTDGDLLGVRLATPSAGANRQPGRGLLVAAGTVTPIQVALPSAAEMTWRPD